MTSVKKMKLNLFFGLIIAAIGYCIIVIISALLQEPEQEQRPIPQILILPPPEMEEDLDIHPPLDLNPADHSNVA